MRSTFHLFPRSNMPQSSRDEGWLLREIENGRGIVPKERSIKPRLGIQRSLCLCLWHQADHLKLAFHLEIELKP